MIDVKEIFEVMQVRGIFKVLYFNEVQLHSEDGDVIEDSEVKDASKVGEVMSLERVKKLVRLLRILNTRRRMIILCF